MSGSLTHKDPARFYRARFLAILLFSSALVTYSSHAAQAVPQVLRDIEYARVGGESLLLDLHLPGEGEGPFPVILWVHGGGWLSGNKSGGPATRQVGRGYAVASINYRLSFEAKFPAQIEDCKAAVRWLRANASRYNLDPNRIGAWGSSAGGHLVALLGTSAGVTDLEGSGGNAEFSSRVRAVVDWFGPTDLLKMEEQDSACDLIDHNSPFSPESQLIGCAIQTCREKTRRANPTSYVTPDDPPFLIMHGTDDCLVPPQQSQDFYDLLTAAGVDATLKFLQGAGHGGSEFDTAENRKLVDDFFDEHLSKDLTLPPDVPVITGADVSGKKLFVFGINFDDGAVIYLNGARQKTRNDEQTPGTTLVARRAGKKIPDDQPVRLRVENRDGRASQEFIFTRQ